MTIRMTTRMPTLVTFAIIYIEDIDSCLRKDERKKELVCSPMLMRRNESGQSTWDSHFSCSTPR